MSNRILFAAIPLALSQVAFGEPNSGSTETKQASTASEPAAAAAPAAGDADNHRAYSLQINLDYVTKYFYHGIIQEDTGFIFQPAAKLTVELYKEDDFTACAIFGTWNSFHGQKTAATTRGDFTEYWYESDVYAGFSLAKGALSLTTTYTFLTSPSDAYETVQELDCTLAFDDSSLLGAFALHPYALFGLETGADASDGAGSDTGAYLELGIAPGFSFDVDKTPIAVSFPVSVGLSLSDYYQDAAGDDDTFGFVRVGVATSIPLPFGDKFGVWTLNAGVSGLFLGDHTSDYNAGDDTEFIANIGLQIVF